MIEHPHDPETTDDYCVSCEDDARAENAALERENARLRRRISYLSALRRVQRTGSPAARSALRDACLEMEAHGDEITGLVR